MRHSHRPDRSRARCRPLAFAGSQAQGPFFDELPQRYYGGTPLAYAACFGLRRALTTLLEEPRLGYTAEGEYPIIDLDDEEHQACRVTGFLPLHAVAANSLRDVYDFLSDMPESEHLEERTADERQRTLTPSAATLGRRPPTIQYSGLTALQLACKMGDARMFKHILGRQTMILWRWGPVTQFMIDLTGVDSAGVGSTDIMELVGQFDATPGTQRFILDDVMNGLLFELFDLKWRQFAGALHGWLLLLDFLYVVPLLLLIAVIKKDPAFLVHSSTWYFPLVSRLPMLIRVTGLISLIPEALFISFWWAMQPPWMKHIGLRLMLAELARWLSAFNVQWKVLSLITYLSAHQLIQQQHGPLQAAAAAAAAAARATGSPAADGDVYFMLTAPGGGTWAEEQGFIWLLLGLSSFLQLRFVMGQWLLPHKRFGIFMLTVDRVMVRRLPSCARRRRWRRR